ncbi:MAG: hypothetical protein EPO40_36200 [Myxococcaceae bacterium]|nr:MAG: hypothetical protein EPO40_36200 [Myxococcaceae bacterium]
MPTKRRGAPYREAPPTDVRECPLCDIDLTARSSTVCPRCGLWWTLARAAGERVRPTATAVDAAPTIDLPLRRGFGHEALMLLTVLAGFGIGSAFIIVTWTPIDRGPLSVMLLVLGLVSLTGLLAAMGLGTVCAVAVALEVARAVAPTRLVGDASTLRIRAWRDDSLLGGFGRTDVTVPREHVTGVFASTWPSAGTARLRLMHASGLALDLGWQESEAVVVRQGEALAAWLSAPADSAGVAQTLSRA